MRIGFLRFLKCDFESHMYLGPQLSKLEDWTSRLFRVFFCVFRGEGGESNANLD